MRAMGTDVANAPKTVTNNSRPYQKVFEVTVRLMLPMARVRSRQAPARTACSRLNRLTHLPGGRKTQFTAAPGALCFHEAEE